MSVVTSYQGYLEREYAEDPYLTALALGAMGMQCQAVINDDMAVAMQTHAMIADFPDASAMQTRTDIAGFIASYGMQSRGVINDDEPVGFESRGVISDDEPFGFETRGMIAALTSLGMQARGVVAAEDPRGLQARGVITSTDARGMQARGVITDSRDEGFQARRVINDDVALGVQTRRIIVNFARAIGMQARRNIADQPKTKGMEALSTKLVHLLTGSYLTTPYMEDPYLTGVMQAILGIQTRGVINARHATGMQTRRVISSDRETGMQARRVIKDFLDANGMQALSLRVAEFGMQCFAQLYNTTNLRIMSSFASRGLTGNNWTANSTEPGSYDPNNVNTDIDEQVWRTQTGATDSVLLYCDTQVSQGVIIDTLSIRNHNLTSSASLFIQGTNDPLFLTVGETIPLQVTPEHIYYIAADAPTTSYRYWRFVIDDTDNPDGFLRFGTVLFGHADIFQGECHTDEIKFGFRDFNDSVPTEGFTNVSNSRALKKILNLDFRYLRYHLANFRILRALATVYRTTHKVLWIPTPDAEDMANTARFAVYGKLTSIPTETHNWKGQAADYVSMSVEVDESK